MPFPSIEDILHSSDRLTFQDPDHLFRSNGLWHALIFQRHNRLNNLKGQYKLNAYDLTEACFDILGVTLPSNNDARLVYYEPGATQGNAPAKLFRHREGPRQTFLNRIQTGLSGGGPRQLKLFSTDGTTLPITVKLQDDWINVLRSHEGNTGILDGRLDDLICWLLRYGSRMKSGQTTSLIKHQGGGIARPNVDAETVSVPNRAELSRFIEDYFGLTSAQISQLMPSLSRVKTEAWQAGSPIQVGTLGGVLWEHYKPAEAVRVFSGNMSGSEEQDNDYTIAECSADTGIKEDELERWIAAINRKGQAIFYGPPGTGKTYTAKLIAKHIISGGSGITETIQFHPAYSYEDFMQGIRPLTDDSGNLRYKNIPGRFMEFCRRVGDLEGVSVLLIDEINRSNISRVFGELMYLLEYRNEEISLAGGGPFKIPKNIRIIGTMNTADRSIALVDHALRRRFAFIPLQPNIDILREYHGKIGFNSKGLIGVLDRLNRDINDPHYLVGTSFFLREDIACVLSDIWEMEIEPYLEEYFFDQPETVDKYRWRVIASEVQPG